MKQSGADTRRFTVQGFVDVSPAGREGATLAPLDAYMFRLDQGALAFEALGNDQNWKEVTQDQAGVTHFRYRYSLRAHAPGYYDNAWALAWSRSVSAPPQVVSGRLSKKWLDRPHLEIDPARALATCLKPADAAPNQIVVRVWETSGTNGPLLLSAPGYRRARETDLLERERGELSLNQGTVSVPVRGHGFGAVKLKR